MQIRWSAFQPKELAIWRFGPRLPPAYTDRHAHTHTHNVESREEAKDLLSFLFAHSPLRRLICPPVSSFNLAAGEL